MDQNMLILKSKKIAKLFFSCTMLIVFLLCFYLVKADTTMNSSFKERIPAGHLEKCIFDPDQLSESERSHRLTIHGDTYFWCSAFRIVEVVELSGPSDSQSDYTYAITEANTSSGSSSTDHTLLNKGGKVFIIHSDIKQSTNPNDWN